MTRGYSPLRSCHRDRGYGFGRLCGAGRVRLRHVEAMMHGERLQVNRLFPAVRVRTVEVKELRAMDPSGLGVGNLKTREELEAAARLAGPIG